MQMTRPSLDCGPFLPSPSIEIPRRPTMKLASFETEGRATYGVVDAICFDGMQCRRDIGYRAL